MARTTKKEAESVTSKSAKSTKATKPATKTKATKTSKTAKPTANGPSEAQEKNDKRSAAPRKAAVRSSESKQPAKRTTKATAPQSAPRTRKTPPRADQVIVETMAQAPSVRTPSPEEIAERAYYLFLERGGHHGCDVDDWLEAERQVTGTHG